MDDDLEQDLGHDDRDDVDGPLDAPATIVCVDCGGTCHLLSTPYEGDDGRTGFRAGDIVSYRCTDCLDRWDVELEGRDGL